MTSAEELQMEVDNGKYLHGSPNSDIDVLVPRKANDLNTEIGCLEAVYATNTVAVAIAMAIIHKTNEDSFSYFNAHSEKEDGSDCKIAIGGYNIELKEGYVYVLPPDTFEILHEGESREIVSKEKVVPIKKIKVTLEDLEQYSPTITIPAYPKK